MERLKVKSLKFIVVLPIVIVLLVVGNQYKNKTQYPEKVSAHTLGSDVHLQNGAAKCSSYCGDCPWTQNDEGVPFRIKGTSTCGGEEWHYVWENNNDQLPAYVPHSSIIEAQPTATPTPDPGTCTGFIVGGACDVYSDSCTTGYIASPGLLPSCPCTCVRQTSTTCDASFPTDKYHACIFDFHGYGLSLGPYRGGFDESNIDHDDNWDGENGPLLEDGITRVVSNFSVVWRKTQHFDAGNYLFTAITDDGFSLSVGGRQIMLDQGWHDAESHSTVWRTEDDVDDVQIFFQHFQGGGDADAKLSIIRLSEIIPPACQDAPDTATFPEGSFLGCVFGWNSSIEPQSVNLFENSDDGNVFFLGTIQQPVTGLEGAQKMESFYGNSGPTVNINGDPTLPFQITNYFAIRWRGKFTFPGNPESQRYLFHTISDDGVKLKIKPAIGHPRPLPTATPTYAPTATPTQTPIPQPTDTPGGPTNTPTQTPTIPPPTPTPSVAVLRLVVSPTTIDSTGTETATLDVRVENIVGFYSASIGLFFSKDYLAVQDEYPGGGSIQVRPGNFPDFANKGQIIINRASQIYGSADFSGTLSDQNPAVSGSGSLFQVDFKGKAIGSGEISLGNAILRNSSGKPIDFNLVNVPAIISVSAPTPTPTPTETLVPIPTTVSSNGAAAVAGLSTKALAYVPTEVPTRTPMPTPNPASDWQEIIRNWNYHGDQHDWGNDVIGGGDAFIELDYFEGTGTSNIVLDWQKGCPYNSTELFFRRENETVWNRFWGGTFHYGEGLQIGVTHDWPWSGPAPTEGDFAGDAKIYLRPNDIDIPNPSPFDYLTFGLPPTPSPNPYTPTYYLNNYGIGTTEPDWTKEKDYRYRATTYLYNSGALTEMPKTKSATATADPPGGDPGYYEYQNRWCVAEAQVKLNPCPFTSTFVEVAKSDEPTRWYSKYSRLNTHAEKKLLYRVGHTLPNGTNIYSSEPADWPSKVPVGGYPFADELELWGPGPTGYLMRGGQTPRSTDPPDAVKAFQFTPKLTQQTQVSLSNHAIEPPEDWWQHSLPRPATTDYDDKYYGQAIFSINGIRIQTQGCSEPNYLDVGTGFTSHNLVVDPKTKESNRNYQNIDPCPYDSTQAYVRKYGQQIWTRGTYQIALNDGLFFGAYHNFPVPAATPPSSVSFVKDNPRMPECIHSKETPPGTCDWFYDWPKGSTNLFYGDYSNLQIFGPYGFYFASAGETNPVPPDDSIISSGIYKQIKLSGGKSHQEPEDYYFMVTTNVLERPVYSEFCADQTQLVVRQKVCLDTPAKDPVNCCPTGRTGNTGGDPLTNLVDFLTNALSSIFNINPTTGFLRAKIGIEEKTYKTSVAPRVLSNWLFAKVERGNQNPSGTGGDTPARVTNYGPRILLERPGVYETDQEIATVRNNRERQWSFNFANSSGVETDVVNSGDIGDITPLSESALVLAAKLKTRPGDKAPKSSDLASVITEGAESQPGLASGGFQPSPSAISHTPSAISDTSSTISYLPSAISPSSPTVLGASTGDTVCPELRTELVDENPCYTEEQGVNLTVSNIKDIFFGPSFPIPDINRIKNLIKIKVDDLDIIGHYLTGLETTTTGGGVAGDTTVDNQVLGTATGRNAQAYSHYTEGGVFQIFRRPDELPPPYKGEQAVAKIKVGFQLPLSGLLPFWEQKETPLVNVDLGEKNDLSFRYIGSVAEEAKCRVWRKLGRSDEPLDSACGLLPPITTGLPDTLPTAFNGTCTICNHQTINNSGKTALRDLLNEVGNNMKVPASLLAGMLHFEGAKAGSSYRDYPYNHIFNYPDADIRNISASNGEDSPCAESAVGAKGPCQFMPSAWDSYKETVKSFEPGRTPKICNLKDCLYAAAAKMRNDAASTATGAGCGKYSLTGTVDGTCNWSLANISAASYHYYGSCGDNYPNTTLDYYINNTCQ